jgi:hypothetical protein
MHRPVPIPLLPTTGPASFPTAPWRPVLCWSQPRYKGTGGSEALTVPRRPYSVPRYPFIYCRANGRDFLRQSQSGHQLLVQQLVHQYSTSAYDKPSQPSNGTPSILSHLKASQVATVGQTCTNVIVVLLLLRGQQKFDLKPTRTPTIGPTALTPVPI